MQQVEETLTLCSAEGPNCDAPEPYTMVSPIIDSSGNAVVEAGQPCACVSRVRGSADVPSSNRKILLTINLQLGDDGWGDPGAPPACPLGTGVGE